MTQMLKVVFACLAVIVSAAVASTAAQAQTPKLAVVDTEAIISQSELGKSATAQMEALRDAKQNEMQSRQEEITALRNRLTEGQSSLSEGEIQNIQAEMETKVAALRRAQDDANRELQKRQQTLIENIEQQVMPIISRVGNEAGYTMIFQKFNSGLVHVDESADITLEVIQRLNELTTSAR